jgi:hypothetical protein
MSSFEKTPILLAVALFALVGVAACRRMQQAHMIRGAAATPELESLPGGNAPVAPIYLQRDPRWGRQSIGGSGESIADVGCALCCVSMGLAHLGIDLKPDELNTRLKKNDGYTERGWLKWETVSEITGNIVMVIEPEQPSFELIDTALRRGQPVVAKVMLPREIFHWVLIVGKREGEYLVKDPLGSGRSIDSLASFGSEIHAIRIIKPTGE